ncbi:transglycosylase domain-containing protein [Verrucomicrobiaceae bacterium 227]
MSWSSYQRESRWAGGLRFLKRAWEFSWKGGLTLMVPFLLAVAWYAWQAGKFNLTEVEKIPARTILVDREGVEFGTIHGANRRLVTSEEIPQFLKDSLFAREDSRFMDHEGVDLIGLARATVRNLKDRDFTQGASTLSMQLARNTYDLRAKKSLNRKFLEIALTYRIESRFSKEEILTHYLNRIYFGAGCNGIEEAALTYFGVPTAKLNRGQSALLVGIIRAPHACSPWRNLEGAIKQRNEVLGRLMATDKITPEELRDIRKIPLNLREPDSEIIETSHGTRALRRPLEVVLDESQITEGGLIVETSLDFSLQQGIEKLITSTSLPDGCQMAAIALDPRNGDILGIVGCREENPSGFNRALDSHRDLGRDIIEPLIATVAMERGHVPIKANPVATGRQLHPGDAVKLLGRFGFSKKLTAGDDLYRGAISASVLEVATAYATILEGGSRPAPVFVRKVEHGNNTLFTRPPAFFPAFSDHAIPQRLPRSTSGFSIPHTDFWVAGLRKNRVIVLWIGYDSPKRFELSEKFQAKLLRDLDHVIDQP